MDYSILEKSALFAGLNKEEIENMLHTVSCHVEHYDKEETVLKAMDKADRIGVILTGRAQGQKTFPNGSQVNVAIRIPGDMIGPAAAFSKVSRYPCDFTALEMTDILFFRKLDFFQLIGMNKIIMQNFVTQLANASYMLQQKLELFSYSGIAQKAAFSLLIYRRQTGKDIFPIPDSVTRWAMQMNVSRPSLHRELKRMEQEEIIRYSSKMIEILDPDALQNVLSD